MARTNAILPLNSWLPWLLALLASNPSAGAVELGVAPSGRHLTLEGKPFFWLGDTGWLLAQVPSRDELELYLRTRAEQGFTVIQLTAVMGEERVWGTTRASSRGDIPFIDGDPLRPAVTPGTDPTDPAQYDYWDHLDYVLERIHAHGFRVALVAHFVGWGGDAIAVHVAAPSTVKLRLDGITGSGNLAAKWTNPATGEEKALGAIDRQTDSFTPPAGWDDALLQVHAPPPNRS